MMKITLTVVLLVLLYSHSVTRVNATSEDCILYPNCSSIRDCSEPVSCISDYDLLESYVQSNKSLISNLAQAFYRTGRSPARFVRITYIFQVPLNLNDSNENNSFADSLEVDICSSLQRIYYWSTSPIYLLGPKLLRYLTLGATFLEEENVMVELPCLQADDEKELLSRLTYLMRVYATSKYSDNRIELLSRFYLQTNTKINRREGPDDNERNYSLIYDLHYGITFFQIILMPLFSLIGGWIIYITKKTVKELIEDNEDLQKYLHRFAIIEFYSKAFVFSFFALIFFLALRELTWYSEETFNSVTLAVVNIVLSLIMMIAIAFILVCTLCCCGDEDNDDDDDNDDDFVINKTCQARTKSGDYFITIMSFTLTGYFFPYMVISFIQDPLHSCFVYIVILSLIILASICQLGWLVAVVGNFEDQRKKAAISCTVLLGIFAVPYLLFTIFAIFSLGSFEDFKDLKNIIVPLITSGIASLIGIGIYFIKKMS